MKNASAHLNELEALRQENAAFRAQIAWLKQKVFSGAKSEKLDQAQLRFHLGELEKMAAKGEERVETITYERVKSAQQTLQVPADTFANLPVVETIEIVPEAVKLELELYERIGEERTFEVDVIAPKLVKREIVCPKYRHKLDRNRAPLVAVAPVRVIAGGYASAGLLAWIGISKYIDHLPLYRLEQVSQRRGAQLSRRSMSDWIEVTANWLAPIYRHMHRGLLADGYLRADETPIRFNDPDEKRGGTTPGCLCVIIRPGADVVFDWRLPRRHGELTSLLTGFRGVLQSDGYEAYPSLPQLRAAAPGCDLVGMLSPHEALLRRGDDRKAESGAVGPAFDRPALPPRSGVGRGERRGATRGAAAAPLCPAAPLCLQLANAYSLISGV